MAEKTLPSLTVELSAAYHLHSIRRMVRSLKPIYDLKKPTVVTLDLAGLTFIGPASLAYMIAVMRRGRESGVVANGSMVLHPRSIAVMTYLHRMDALQVLFEKEPNEIPDPVVRHDASGLKECEHFSSEDGGRRVAGALAKAVQEEVATDKLTAAALDICLTELAENVYFHADTSHGGFAAAQTFKNSKEIEVAIVDLGIGIAASLGENPDHASEAADDITAIKAAVRPLVTATPERNSGYGLALTRFLLEINDGRLIVWSRKGMVQFGEKHVEKRIEDLPGTIVALRLHTDRPFDIARAYERLNSAIEEIEGPPDDDVRTLRPNATS